MRRRLKPVNEASISLNRENRSGRLTLIFSISVLGCVGLYWIIMLVTRCANIDAYFVTDHHDTAMDYFNMLSNIYHGDPYYADANYPAICFLFWKVMAHFLQLPWIEEYGSGKYLREDMVAQLGYIFFVLICVLAIWELLSHTAKGNTLQKGLFGAALLFSGPMIYLLERGNILLAVVPFTLLFLALYDSPKRWQRIIAYIALAFAAAIKIYPAVLGLLVLQKKRYKETLLLLILGVVFFAAPFLAFGGVGTILKMINGVGAANSLQTNIGVGYNYCASNLLQFFCGVLGYRLEAVPVWVPFLAAGGCLIAFLLSQTEWQRIYCLILLCILFPAFSYTYTLVLLFVPIVSFFSRSTVREQGRFRVVYAVLFGLTLIPYALPIAERVNRVLGVESARFPASWGMLFIAGALLLIPVLIIIESVWNRILSKDPEVLQAEGEE